MPSRKPNYPASIHLRPAGTYDLVQDDGLADAGNFRIPLQLLTQEEIQDLTRRQLARDYESFFGGFLKDPSQRKTFALVAMRKETVDGFHFGSDGNDFTQPTLRIAFMFCPDCTARF